MNKQSLAKINRYLAWLTTLVAVASFTVSYVLGYRDMPRGSSEYSLYGNLSAGIAVLAVIHGIISVILFGFPRFDMSNAKTRHVWIGYILFIVMFVGESIGSSAGVVYRVFNIIMWVLILVHVILGIQMAMARNKGSDNMAELHRGSRTKAA
jgi:uncharacterized membrane protein